VVLHALAKNREDRYQSAEEFREHLLAAELGSPSTMSIDAVGAGAGVGASPIAGLADEVQPVVTVEDLTGEASADLDDFEAMLRGAGGDTTAMPVAEVEAALVADSGPITNPFAAIGVEIPANTDSTPRAPLGGSGKPSQGLIWGIGSGAAVVLVGLIVWFFALGGLNFNVTPTGPSGVQVTEVTGTPYAQGSATLIDQGLLVTKVYEVSDTVPADSIIRTDPVAGTSVPENTLITIYVSSGKNTVRVPSLVDLTEADAQALLVSLKLTLGTITQSNSASAAAGKVISSDPVLNAEVPEGTAINLVVSNGKVTVPDVRNLDISDARSILTAPDVGFTVTIETAEECLGTQGTVVLDQSILPGLAPQKSAVVLTVACNP